VTESLSPRLAFDPPSTTVPGYVPAGGSTDNGSGQWDGIVGRLSNDHASPVPTATMREFHAVVGGREQDGLWGIAELPDNRFVVVGGTAVPTTPGSGAATFPFTNTQLDWNSLTNYCVGVVMAFDASPTRLSPPQNLLLRSSAAVGSAGTPRTHVRDVAVNVWPSTVAPPWEHRIGIVGTTDDSTLFNWFTLGSVVPTTPFGSNTDGFVATALDIPGGPPDLLFLGGSFHGDAGNSSYTGIASWNEYVDHFSVVGQAVGSYANQDLLVANYFIDTPHSSQALLPYRNDLVVASPIETPAQVGTRNATQPSVLFPLSGLAYDQWTLGSPAGGGIAVDERARVNLAGSTSAMGYPAVGPLARSYRGGQDAVRTVVDMVPLRVGRTDGTGSQVHNGQPIPAPPSGMTGGTTPTAALLPFGAQTGAAPVPGSVGRMLIDWKGVAPGPTPSPPNPVHWLLIDRLPANSQIGGSVIQLGLPTPPSALTLGIEDWVPFGVIYSAVPTPVPQSLEVPLVLPPPVPGGVTFSVQALTLLSSSLPCSGCGNLVASPAIIFSY